MDKPGLSPTILEDQGITYDSKIITGGRDEYAEGSNENILLPHHVESVREALLDFGSPLPRTIREEFEKEYETLGVSELPPDAAYYDDQALPRRSREALAAVAKTNFDENAEIADEARRLQSCDVSEDEWALFMRAHIFKRYKDVYPSPPHKVELFDKWALESNVLWNERRTYANPDRRLKQRTDPKPDLTYGFPIINNTTPNLFGQEEAVENFSLKVLAELRRNELISSPQTSLLTWARGHRKSMNQPGLLCFPWAIVELKPVEVQKHSGRFCYCQAANGASAALKIYEDLSSRARGELDDKKMVCIWASTLEVTWGVMAARLIVSNMHFWASRVLRPKISNYISQVRMNARLAVDPGPLGVSLDHLTLVNGEALPDVPSPRTQISACSTRTIPATESQATDLLAQSTLSTRATRPSTPLINTVLPEVSPTIMPLLSQSADRPAPSERPAARMPGSPIHSEDTEIDGPTVLTTPCREDDTGSLAPAEPHTTRTEGTDDASDGEGNTYHQLGEGSTDGQTPNLYSIIEGMRHLKISAKDAPTTPRPRTPATRELATNTACASNSAVDALIGSVNPPSMPCSTAPSSSVPITSILAFGTSATDSLPFSTSTLNEPQAFIGPGTEKFPFVPHTEVKGFGTARETCHYQTITFQAPYMTESFEELRLADYRNNRKGRNDAKVSTDVIVAASAPFSNLPTATDPATVLLTDNALSASMPSLAKPYTALPTSNMSASNAPAFGSTLAFAAPAMSQPATTTPAPSTSLMSTPSGNASPEKTPLGMEPSESTPAAGTPSSQPWKQASDRRPEGARDATHAAQETPSVATVVDLGSESESGHDSSEQFDDGRDLDYEEHSNDERHLDGGNEDGEDSEESEQCGESTSNREDDAPRRLWGDDLLDNHVVNEIIDTLSEPNITVRFHNAAQMQCYVHRRDQWRCEPLDNIYNFLNAALNLSPRDGITYEKVGTEHWGIRELIRRAIRRMCYSDRRHFAELLWKAGFVWDRHRLWHLDHDYDIPAGLHVCA